MRIPGSTNAGKESKKRRRRQAKQRTGRWRERMLFCMNEMSVRARSSKAGHLRQNTRTQVTNWLLTILLSTSRQTISVSSETGHPRHLQRLAGVSGIVIGVTRSTTQQLADPTSRDSAIDHGSQLDNKAEKGAKGEGRDDDHLSLALQRYSCTRWQRWYAVTTLWYHVITFALVALR